MPELPEVETIARTLSPQIAGRQIVKVELLNQGSLQGNIGLEHLIGLKVSKENPTSRRGKLLIINCENENNKLDNTITGFALHFKMTGRVMVYSNNVEPNKHTRAIVRFSDNTSLFFDDIRKFGYIRVLEQNSDQVWNFLKNLGPEPLEIDNITFFNCFAGKKSKIKTLLLDQKCIAGCGNIYADEALFRAKISPTRPCNTINKETYYSLHGHLQDVFNESIAACGSSIKDYRTANGDVGSFQNKFAVYGKFNTPCISCGQILEKTKVAGRMTTFCPSCQK